MHKLKQLTKHSRPRSRAAFSLVELLVVLAIISVLASLLSTALNHAKAKTHRITCLSNLRQLQVSWFLYTDENDDQLPLNKTMPGSNDGVVRGRNQPNSWVVGNPKEDATVANIVKGSLFPYTKSAAIYRCPADTSKVVGLDAVRRTRSYSMSAYMNGDDAPVDPRVKVSYTEIATPTPDRVFVFIEEHQDSVWSGMFDVPIKDKFSLASASWSSTPSDRHNQGCNLSFADGHVEYWKWYGAKKFDLNSGPGELRDLKRLQDSIPKP
jgi:prepilin-type N-terminal cleavage/methylation domain-containing protein/prepilin-type processing-associated H-X9-DG protein